MFSRPTYRLAHWTICSYYKSAVNQFCRHSLSTYYVLSDYPGAVRTVMVSEVGSTQREAEGVKEANKGPDTRRPCCPHPSAQAVAPGRCRRSVIAHGTVSDPPSPSTQNLHVVVAFQEIRGQVNVCPRAAVTKCHTLGAIQFWSLEV